MTLDKLSEKYNFTNSRIVFPLGSDGDGCFEGEKCPNYINGFSACNGEICFDECMRFTCESCEVLDEYD